MKLRGLALLALPCALYAAGEVREEVLVVVNNHIITLRNFQQAVEEGSAALYREFTGKELDTKLHTAREKILQGLVDNFVIQDKAADLGIVIPDDNIRAYVESVKKQNNFTSDADFERALKGTLGIDLPEYLKREKEELLKQEVLRREVFSKIAVEDQELKAYYEEHKEDYRLPGRFRIRELVVSKGGTSAELAAARAKVATIEAALKQGASFESLVKQYSNAPSQSTGGDLGWLPKGVLRQEIESAALALKPGQVAQPVETDTDIYLVQLTSSELDNFKPFNEVAAEIRRKLQEPKAETAIDSYIQGLRIRANIRYMVPKDTILKG